jgi:hypothetical protein
MSDYKAALSLIAAFTTAITAKAAKEEHKPCLSSKESMQAYAKATNAKKASFNVVEKNYTDIEYIV